MHDVYPNLSWGHWREDPQFPHSISKQEPPSRVRLQWPSHRNGSCDPEWVVGLSARCNTASTAGESSSLDRRKMWGVSGTEASSSDFSRVKAFRVHESHNSRRHASEVTNHASRATGLCTCRVRARPDRATRTHVCTVHRNYTQHKDTLRRFCKPSAGGSDRRAHMHMKNDGARSALRRPSLSSLVSRVVGPIY
jgi:hypothetical protein